MYKAGIIGAGYIAESHARGYAALENVTLTIVADHDLARAKSFAGQYQAEAVKDLETLLASDVDLVSICTPTPSHAELANTLMRAGKHVLCEKPIARTLQEAQSMVDTAEQSGVKLMVAHVSRYEADHFKAKNILESGEIGPLRMAFHAITSPFPGWSAQNWLGDQSKSGGPVVDLAIHSVDYLMWLFKSPVRRVYALGTQKQNGQHHYVLLNLQFENGGLGLIESGWAQPQGSALCCRVELCAENGRIAWDYNQIDGMQTWIEGKGPQSYVLEGENSFAAQIGDFIHCIENDLPAPIPGGEARDALQVCLAALESLESGRSVDVNQLPDIPANSRKRKSI